MQPPARQPLSARPKALIKAINGHDGHVITPSNALSSLTTQPVFGEAQEEANFGILYAICDAIGPGQFLAVPVPEIRRVWH